MASSLKLPDEIAKDLEEGVVSGNKENLAQKKRNMDHFKKFLIDVEHIDKPLEEMINDPVAFETYVQNYFFGIRVEETIKDKKTGKLSKTGQMVLPKMGYAKNIKASLFSVFVKDYKVLLRYWFKII